MVNRDLNCGEFEKYQEDRIDSRYGVQYIFFFDNEYGASVVKKPGSYGYELDLWELAVLGPDGDLNYDTPITGDVLGYLTDEEVRGTLKKIQKL